MAGNHQPPPPQNPQPNGGQQGGAGYVGPSGSQQPPSKAGTSLAGRMTRGFLGTVFDGPNIAAGVMGGGLLYAANRYPAFGENLRNDLTGAFNWTTNEAFPFIYEFTRDLIRASVEYGFSDYLAAGAAVVTGAIILGGIMKLNGSGIGIGEGAKNLALGMYDFARFSTIFAVGVVGALAAFQTMAEGGFDVNSAPIERAPYVAPDNSAPLPDLGLGN